MKKKQDSEAEKLTMDEVLRRMLATPPEAHQLSKKPRPKQTQKAVKKKPA